MKLIRNSSAEIVIREDIINRKAEALPLLLFIFFLLFYFDLNCFGVDVRGFGFIFLFLRRNDGEVTDLGVCSHYDNAAGGAGVDGNFSYSRRLPRLLRQYKRAYRSCR